MVKSRYEIDSDARTADKVEDSYKVSVGRGDQVERINWSGMNNGNSIQIGKWRYRITNGT